MAAAPTPIIRCLTFDVEEYFHVEAARRRIGPASWSDWPRRAEASVDRLLQLCADHRCRATFFILGDVARAAPSLARRCADAGHEVASHGSMHDRLHRLSPIAMLDDILASKTLLEDQIGRPVLGYRAPTWSVTRRTAWAIDVLLQAGFTYDASVFPVRHPQYGVADAPLWPHALRGGDGQRSILEVPPLVWRVGPRRVGAAGGGYFRMLPLTVMKRGLRQAEAENRPAVLYFHPWEFDADLPRMPLGILSRLRTYIGLRAAIRRLGALLDEFGPMNSIAANLPRLNALARDRAPFSLLAA